jgi:hypothetical protein
LARTLVKNIGPMQDAIKNAITTELNMSLKMEESGLNTEEPSILIIVIAL